MAKVLVTGAKGFIAAHLIPQLRAEGHEVVEIHRERGDLSRMESWAELPRTDTVVHLAGRSFVPESWGDPAGYLAANVMGTAAALDYCRKTGAGLVYLSSYMYGNPDRLPIPESAPIRVNNPYALSKKLAEDVAGFYADRFQVNVSILRLFNVYGIGQGDRFLIPSVIRQVRSGQPIRVKDLGPRRDYVYVADVVRAIAKAVTVGRGLSICNIGFGTSHSVEEMIREVQEAWHTDLPVVDEGERRPDEIMDTVADIREARRLLGWEPAFGLREGLRDMASRMAGHEPGAER